MIKNYLLSYLAMAYMPLMTVFTILIFVSIFTLMNVSAVLMKVVIGILEIVAIIILGLFLKNYFPSYMDEKGKNLATKEDYTKAFIKIFGDSSIEADILK